MRRIWFRGITIDDGKMVYGDLLQYRVYPVIFDNNKVQHEVRADTVGKYIGLEDKDSLKIYEFDILECIYKRADGTIEKFNRQVWEYSPFRSYQWIVAHVVKIIGNTFQNPELLEKKEK